MLGQENKVPLSTKILCREIHDTIHDALVNQDVPQDFFPNFTTSSMTFKNSQAKAVVSQKSCWLRTHKERAVTWGQGPGNEDFEPCNVPSLNLIHPNDPRQLTYTYHIHIVYIFMYIYKYIYISYHHIHRLYRFHSVSYLFLSSHPRSEADPGARRRDPAQHLE